jgi:hypothetical protein
MRQNLRNRLTDWIIGGFIAAIIAKGVDVVWQKAHEMNWRQLANDPIVQSFVFMWALPVLMTLVFLRRFKLDMNADNALTKIWLGGMTVSLIGVLAFNLIRGKADEVFDSLKQDPFSALVLFTPMIVFYIFMMLDTFSQGDGATRRK